MEDKFIELAKNFGLEDSDLDALKTLEPGEDGKIDFSPFTSKVFNNHKESLKADAEYVSQFTKDYENRMIGLDNQKKRAIRKEFGLVDIKEDDLKQIKFEDLLKKAKEATAGTKDTDLQAERQKYLDAMEALESAKTTHQQELEAERAKTNQFIKGYEVKNKLQSVILSETSIKREALDVSMGAYNGYLEMKGWKLDQDTKGNLILIDTKSNSIAMNNNAPVKVAETIKELFASLAPTQNGRGSMDNFRKPTEDGTIKLSDKANERLAMFAKGL